MERNKVLNFVAGRLGQARLSGIDLPNEMREAVVREVEIWNEMMPEATITEDDIITRAEAKQKQATETQLQRQLQSAPSAVREGGLFSPSSRSGG